MKFCAKATGLLLIICFFYNNAKTQQLSWANRVGGTGGDFSNAVTTDAAGNVYKAGSFSGTNVDFDPGAGTFLMTSVGSIDAFVSKYDANGQFIWAFRFGGGNRDNVNAMEIDAAGNVLITGYFRGTGIDFDPGPAVTNLSSNGDSGPDPGYGGDLFVAKYDANGQFLWAFNAGGSELYDSGIAITADAANNVYVGGYFRHNVDFDPSAGTAMLNSASGTIVLAKYSPAGAFQWAFNFGLGNDNNSIFDLKTNAAGDVFVTGYFQGTNIDFDPSAATAPLSSNGAYEIFFAKYNTNGQYQFAFKIGGGGNDVGRGVTLDNAGNIYILGDFSGNNIDFDPGAGTALLSANGGGTDVFLARYSPTGQYVWAFGFGGTPGEFGWKVSTDGSHLFVTGGFTGTADMDPSANIDNLVSAGGYDIFLGKYTFNGEYLCSFRIGGTGNDFGQSVVSPSNNLFYITGTFIGANVDFDPTPTISNLSSAGVEDIFLAKYTWPDNTAPMGTLSGSGPFCTGEQAQLTFTATVGVGPFIVTYNNGVTDIIQTNVQSSVPFNIIPNPTSTTSYTLVSVKDAQRCAETNFIPGNMVVVQVNDCIINDYTEVLGLDICKNALTVADGTAYNVGDTVLLIQMKGALVNETNTAAFGTIVNYRNAGNYEFNYISAKNGNELELRNIVERQYDIADGKVQLVRVPYYQDFTLVEQLTCLPWDGSKGGVLVFNVANTLTLQDDIDVTGRGFRGGADPFSNPVAVHCYENQFFYSPNPDLASQKGESIGIMPLDKSFGKGAFANGGGGGNSHNSGGGGGSNGNAGGFGGYNYELIPCNTNVPFDNRGFGGNPLLYSNARNSIFLGGGGGGGQSNNPEAFEATGGNGGGIVIISANTITGNNNTIRANGADGRPCIGLGTGCHEGMGGGGAGGVVVLNANNFDVPLNVSTKGGKGADMIVAAIGKLGPGGGGSGGITWVNSPALPVNLITDNSGGANGTNTAYSNNPWGATAGQPGSDLFDLVLPVATDPFKANIDSVRFTADMAGCALFHFNGLAYTNTYPAASWLWNFGDNQVSSVQNPSHVYAASGTYTVKLVVTDANGCKDSISNDVNITVVDFDFDYDIDACDPLTVQFNGTGPTTNNPYWHFGDNSDATGVLNTQHTFAAPGTYIIRYIAGTNICADTLQRTIRVGVDPADIIITPDTTICYGTTKQLRTVASADFCWTPITYLNDPLLANPVTSTPHDITYYFQAEITGENLIQNGDFSQGNTGFQTGYLYRPAGSDIHTYTVATNPAAWNSSFAACTDHTTGTGNMLLLSGSAPGNDTVWRQVVNVQPNTIYRFTCWMQFASNANPWTSGVRINNIDIVSSLLPGSGTCNWKRFYIDWNSGAANTADILLFSAAPNTSGNDFALDDISFAPLPVIMIDSVRITVDTALIRTSNDATICSGTSVQLNTTGGTTYSWSPVSGLSDPSIADPLATPLVPTEYIVTGVNANGCTGKDTVNVFFFPEPVMTVTDDTSICRNSSVQLSASGGVTYTWFPAATLDNPSIATPIATPVDNTLYYVTITDGNFCNYLDSVRVDFRSPPLFTIDGPGQVCFEDTIRLVAAGGNVYTWQPTGGISNTSVPDPLVYPTVTTTYQVTITETDCNESATLSKQVVVLSLPNVQASKPNDIDCSNDRSQLLATGAAQYTWSPGSTLSATNIPNPIATPTVATQYTVWGTAANGCTNYDTITVKVDNINRGGYLMPTGFTPNGDGLNDCYGIRYWGVIEKLDFSIYNRWGERVFFTTDPRQCWDGRYKGVKQDAAVFVYVIRARTFCESEVFRKGTFVLIR